MNTFLEALAAAGPAPDRGGKMDLYGQFVGAWDLDVVEFHDNGTTRRRPGEWHFGWVLEGRAIQDVWCVPPRGQRDGDATANSNRYGTTLRVYDPRTDAWRILWTEPVGQSYLTMIGGAEGDDIVQLGRNAAGERTRWGFYEITPDAFLWRGETSADEGASWKRVVEFSARRR
jgi:hypothetical protein